MEDHSIAAVYLKEALKLAENYRGSCAPNPSVGAVLVKDGELIARGFHERCGLPHAEVIAIQSVGKKAEGSTLYVTLEPCCHFGRTPPCTNLIIEAGIKTVYYGLGDPNPRVEGKGVQQLKQSGIPCHKICLAEIDTFYESYRYWTLCRRPFVTAKLAISLDGKIAGPVGARVNLTGEALREFTHQRRKKSDALLTTISTILKDDPQLNVRINGKNIKKAVYVLDTHLRLPLTAILHGTAEKITVFHGETVIDQRKKALIKQGARCVPVAHKKEGLDLTSILEIIGQDGIHDLWIEAGGRCFQSFLNQSLLNRAFIYIAPKILGQEATPAFSAPASFSGRTIQWRSYGDDVMGDISF